MAQFRLDWARMASKSRLRKLVGREDKVNSSIPFYSYCIRVLFIVQLLMYVGHWEDKRGREGEGQRLGCTLCLIV